MCYGVAGTNAGGELFNQDATDKTSGRFALQAVQFAGERSPEPITPIRVAGEKQPVRNLALHGVVPKLAMYCSATGKGFSTGVVQGNSFSRISAVSPKLAL